MEWQQHCPLEKPNPHCWRQANANEHGVVWCHQQPAREAIMVTGGQVVFLCNLCIDISAREFLGVLPQKVGMKSTSSSLTVEQILM